MQSQEKTAEARAEKGEEKGVKIFSMNFGIVKKVMMFARAVTCGLSVRSDMLSFCFLLGNSVGVFVVWYN